MAELLNRRLTAYDDEPFVMDGYPQERPVPVVDFDAAVAMMAARTEEHVDVFWDRGWGDGDEPLMISIIVSGDGQNPIGFVARDTYDRLRSEDVVGPNGLRTMKARRLHPFLGEREATHG
jgi:hypothetical protein